MREVIFMLFIYLNFIITFILRCKTILKEYLFLTIVFIINHLFATSEMFFFKFLCIISS